MRSKPIAIVTGGAGFIGSHMVDLLLAEGFVVRVIDNLSGGHEKNLVHNLNNPDLHLFKEDICDIEPTNIAFKNAKYVFHFAGIGDIVPSIEDTVRITGPNVPLRILGTFSLVLLK